MNSEDLVKDGGVEWCALISSCKNNKITTSCWTVFDRRIWNQPRKYIPCPRTKNKPQRDGKRGTITIKSNAIPATNSWHTKWRTMVPKKFSHCCEDSEPHVTLPSLGTQQRDWESPGNLTLKHSGMWLQDFHRTGGSRDSRLGGHK